MVSSDHFTVGLREVQEDWSMVDLLDAHTTLDLLDEAQAKAEAEARAKQDRRR